MTVKDIIYSALNRRNMKISDLAAEVNSDRRNIHTALSRNEGMGMKVETLLVLLDTLGYQIVVMDGEDEMILDGEQDDIEYERGRK